MIIRKSLLPLLAVMSMVVLTMSCKDDKKNEEKEKMEATAKSEEVKMKKEKEREEAVSSSIAGKAMATADLDTLVTALKAADLSTMLSEPGSYTVFAPSDHAFSKLKKGTLDDLLKPENKENLKGVLQYHVVRGKVMVNQLIDAIKSGNGKYTFKTVTGDDLTAMMENDKVVIIGGNGSKTEILQGNIDASNGVVHIINDVLMAKK